MPEKRRKIISAQSNQRRDIPRTSEGEDTGSKGAAGTGRGIRAAPRRHNADSLGKRKMLGMGRATVPDTFAPSHLRSTASTAGSAAEQAAVIKLRKYSVLSSQFIIMPVAVETLGSWSDDSLRFVTELGRRITEATGDNRETTFLFQRLSIAIQRGNAISCRGSFPMPL
jgi:hypothetical protein